MMWVLNDSSHLGNNVRFSNHSELLIKYCLFVFFFSLLFCFLFSAISQGFWLWIPAHFSHWKFFRNPGGMSICYDIYKCLSCLICLVTKNKYGPALKKKNLKNVGLSLEIVWHYSTVLSNWSLEGHVQCPFFAKMST